MHPKYFRPLKANSAHKVSASELCQSLNDKVQSSISSACRNHYPTLSAMNAQYFVLNNTVKDKTKTIPVADREGP
jgi:hypothetical protein